MIQHLELECSFWQFWKTEAFGHACHTLKGLLCLTLKFVMIKFDGWNTDRLPILYYGPEATKTLYISCANMKLQATETCRTFLEA